MLKRRTIPPWGQFGGHLGFRQVQCGNGRGTWGRSCMYNLKIYPGPSLTLNPNPNLTLNPIPKP